MSHGQKSEPLKTEDSYTVPSHRVLHAVIPERIFNHVKAQAALSGMAFKEYLERFLLEAVPYDGTHRSGRDTAGQDTQPSERGKQD